MPFISTKLSPMSLSIPPSNRLRWTVTVPALSLPLAVSFIYFVWMPGTTPGKSAYTGIKFWMLLWPVIVGLWIVRDNSSGLKSERGNWLARLLPGKPQQEGQASRRSTGSSILSGALFGLGVAGIAYLLLIIPAVGDALRESGPQIREQVTAFGIMKFYFVFGIFISVIHSALEEFYWRGFVFGHLRRLMPLWSAHLLAAVAFAAHHVVVLHEFFPSGIAWLLGGAVAIGGLVWSFLYHRHGTLLGAWVSHLIADVAVLAIGWRLMHG